MRLHYKGAYDLNPESIPHKEHIPGAVKFKEAEDTKELSKTATVISIIVMVIMGIFATMRMGRFIFDGSLQMWLGILFPFAILFPHEILHAICFKEDVYLYTNWKQGMLFVVGSETMSKGRFILMSMLPNVVFGILPYIVGMIYPQFVFGLVFGILSAGMGGRRLLQCLQCCDTDAKGSQDVFVSISFLLVYALSMWRQRNQKQF